MGKIARSENSRQTVREHLRELRRRVFICVGAFISFAILIYFVYKPIINILSSTLGSELYYNTPAGGFSFAMRICTTGAMVLTIPVIVYNLIKFIKPAFKKLLSTKRIILVSIFSTVLATSGALFAYFIILPESLHFFGDFSIAGLSALINADDYLDFVTNIIIVFSAVFQVPLLMLLFDSIKPIPPKKLLNNEIWVVIVSLIITILAPFNYDMVSSLAIAVPIIGLYNLSIIFILIRHFLVKNNIFQTKKYTIVKPLQIEDFTLTNSAFNNMSQDIVNVKTKLYQPNLVNNRHTVMDFKVKTLKNIQADNFANKQNQKNVIQPHSRGRVFSDIIPRRANHA